MLPLNVRFIDNKKFMWDGKVYETEAEAKNIEEGYKKNKFEVSMIPEVPNEDAQVEQHPDGHPDGYRDRVASFGKGKCFLYTRRVVTEVMVEGQSH